MSDTSNIKILADREDIVAIADAVRNKTGASGEMTLGGIASGINGIEIGSDPVLQSKTVTPTTNSQNVTPDSGYDGLSQVTVNAVPTATQATPTVSIDSAGKITATATQTAGYVVAGTKTGTKQMTTQAAKTITPSTSSQTAVAKNVYTTGAVTVAAIPSTYVKPTTTKTATTYTPTTSNQTIAAGTYCSGIQTIKGDANLRAENIAEGVSIFGVTGTHSGGSGSGGGGGGSAEICTVTIDHMDTLNAHIVTTIVENGVESIYTFGGDPSSTNNLPISISNVKCGSAIVVEMYNDYMRPSERYIELDNGATIVEFYRSSGVYPVNKWTTTLVLKAPTTANVNCCITIM